MSGYINILYDIDDKDYVIMTQANDSDFLIIKGVTGKYLEALKIFRTLQREADPNAN